MSYSLCNFFRRNSRFIQIYSIPLLLLCLLFLWKPKVPISKAGKPVFTPEDYHPQYGAYIMLLMAGYWMTECLPLPVTSLIPVALVPLFQIAGSDETARNYLSHTILFLVGGCIIALAFEYSALHMRIALKVCSTIGAQTHILLLGIMLVGNFLSMFMNNTSTTSMMLPIVKVIIDEFRRQMVHDDLGDEEREKAESEVKRIRKMFLIAIAYASNIGGTGIITGTATNIIATQQIDKTTSEVKMFPTNYKDATECENALTFSFHMWVAFNFVPMMLNIMFTWMYLLIHFMGFPDKLKFWRKQTEKELNKMEIQNSVADSVKTAMKGKYTELGSMSFHEIVVVVMFCILVTLWIFRDPKAFKGWGNHPFFPIDDMVKDATPTLLICFFLFIIPKKISYYKNIFKGGLTEGVLDAAMSWPVAEKKLPWGPFILLGGGNAMAMAAKKAGLNVAVGDFLAKNEFIEQRSPWQILLITMLIVALLTSVASNTATAIILSPVIIELSRKKDIHPLYLLIPPTVSASYAFVLPVSTPPNAIVYEDAGGDLLQSDMVKAGLPVTLICNVVLFLCVQFFLAYLFGFNSYNCACSSPLTKCNP